MRVIVIGAGLAGLALAQGLRNAGIEVEVYERDATVEARFQGYRVGLFDSALANLQTCLPERWHALLTRIGGVLTGDGRAVDPQLTELVRIPRRDEGLLFDRHVLRHLLLTGLDVRFGKKLDRYVELPDGQVRAEFADGSAATGDLLVGADGLGSTVRRQLLPETEILGTGVNGVIGRTPLTDRFAALVPGWTTVVMGEGRQLYLGKMPVERSPRLVAAELAPEVQLPDAAGYLRWVMLVPPGGPVDVEREYAGQDGIDVVLDLVRGWHPELRALIEQGDPDNSGIGPIRYAEPIPPWPTRTVTLLGDSAHPMPPGGLGANLALGDAALLTTQLASADPLLPAIASYERQMLTTAEKAHHEAMATLPVFQHLRQS